MVSQKRKHEASVASTEATANGKQIKKPALEQQTSVQENFGSELFSRSVVERYRDEYAASEPYKHAVISNLINDALLRRVRAEIISNVHFTPKETDIYKIHQSGDLANLSGLPSSALALFPSLLKLRDSLYSAEFRAWVSEVAGAGPLSGTKTDMAVNVYAPGCHLLCHDDVIGSRRVSYILYLTDPDKAWRAGWGGALRLYPTERKIDSEGKEVKVPVPEWSKVIPPAWNQLSFFAVQPGESFHDVEEVYKRAEGEEGEEVDGGRIRMAISGWFHIPQEGEEGFEPGLEERLAERSSLQQLQGKNDEFDLPKEQWIEYGSADGETEAQEEDSDEELTEKDLEFLLRFMTPQYLTPDTVDDLSSLFAEESSLQLANFLSRKFAARLKPEISAMDAQSSDPTQGWQTAAPPHKHRYRFRHPAETKAKAKGGESTAYDELVDVFLPSRAFHKWLALATGLSLKRASVLARRFRRGLDYTLATGYEKQEAQLEFCLNVTPTKGWGGDEEEEQQDEESEKQSGDAKPSQNGTSNGKAKEAPTAPEPEAEAEDEEDTVGGYEIYMAGDEPDADDAFTDAGTDAGSDAGVPIPPHASSSTGAGNRRIAKRRARKQKADPAIYRAASGDEDDDGILFSNPAGWNSLAVVLRDTGVLRFVKFVSQAAKGDRWDVVGAVEVEDEDDDDEEGDEEGAEDDDDDHDGQDDEEDEDGDEDGEAA